MTIMPAALKLRMAIPRLIMRADEAAGRTSMLPDSLKKGLHQYVLRWSGTLLGVSLIYDTKWESPNNIIIATHTMIDSAAWNVRLVTWTSNHISKESMAYIPSQADFDGDETRFRQDAALLIMAAPVPEE